MAGNTRSLIKRGLGPGRDGNRRPENTDVMKSFENLRLAVRESNDTKSAGGKSMGSMTYSRLLDKVVGLVGIKEAASGMTRLLLVCCYRNSLPGATSRVAS